MSAGSPFEGRYHTLDVGPFFRPVIKDRPTVNTPGIPGYTPTPTLNPLDRGKMPIPPVIDPNWKPGDNPLNRPRPNPINRPVGGPIIPTTDGPHGLPTRLLEPPAKTDWHYGPPEIPTWLYGPMAGLFGGIRPSDVDPSFGYFPESKTWGPQPGGKSK